MAKQIAIDIDIQGTKDVIDLQKAIRATNKELKETKDIEAYDQLATDLVKLKSQLQEARKAQRQAVDSFKATDEGVGAYSRLSAQLRVARNNLKDLQASGQTTGEEVEKLTNEVNQLDTQLKNIDRSVGQTNREVGAYEEAVRKAVGITDAQTGAFTRLEGKAKILRRTYKDLVAVQGENTAEAKKLKKELDKVEKQLKATGGQAERTSNRIGGVRSSLRSLGPAFTSIASGFLIFSELPQIFADVSDGLQTVGNLISPTIALNDALNTSIENSIDGYVDERLELENLFTTAKADNSTREEKSAAIDVINEQYGQYLPSLLTEKSTLQEIALAQTLATKALIENIAARASREKLESDIKRLAKAEAASIENEAQAESTLGTITDGVSRAAAALFSLGNTEVFGVGQETQVSNITEGLNDLEKSAAKAAIASGPEFKERFASTLFEVEDELKRAFANAGEIGSAEAGKAAEQAGQKARQVAARLAKEQEAALKKRIQDQQKALSEIAKAEAKQALDILKLEEQNVLNQIKNQEDGLQKELNLEANATTKRLNSFKAESDKFEAEAISRQERINKAFGEGSQQALNTAASIDAQRILLATQTDTAIETENVASLARQEAIRKTFADKEKQEAQKELQDRLTELQAQQTAITTALAQEELRIRELRAKGQIDAVEAEKQAFDARLAALKSQLAQLSEQEVALSVESAFGADVAQSEFDKIAADRQNLNTQLAELEEQQTKKLTEETNKRKEERQKDVAFALNTLSSVTSAIGNIAEAANAAETARLEKLQEERAKNIESLNGELQKASGLEKAFLQQQVNQEIAAAEDLAAQKERIEKKAAAGNKAIAIVQAVINTALGITNALASLPPPASFITAAITGALGAVEIATIAAQPLATGGIVGFNNGGRVSQGQNIATQPNGDNVLATLKRGEVVLNSGQQQRLGGASTFRAAGVPGFQGGGIVSPPIGAPTLAQAQTSEQQSAETLNKLAQMLEATNGRIDRLQVIYTTETETAIDNDKKDRKQITQRATL